jgi:DNA-binding LytR/AlgR family response regulator
MPSAIVAEDEQLLRDELLLLLREAWPELQVLAACEDGGEAVDAIATHKPDVAFLDIRMPGLTGLDVAAAAGISSPGTQVVFVTAYNQYAIDAFERGAVDYLLKPVAPDRLAATLKRVRTRLEAGPVPSEALAAIVEQLRGQIPSMATQPPLQWITASMGRETKLILVDDVAYFQADDKYTVVMTAEGEALIRKPIRDLLGVLDPAVFKQIHRSTIVNMRAVAGVTRDDTGRGTLRLRNRSETLPVSVSYMPLFRNM